MIAQSSLHDNCGHPLLIQAIANGRLEIVKYLISNGISATAKDKISGLAPLAAAAAAANGYEDIVFTLLQREDVIKQWTFEVFKEEIRRGIGGQTLPIRTPRAVASKNGHFALAHILSWHCAALPLETCILPRFEALNKNSSGVESTRIRATKNRMAAAASYVELGIKQLGNWAFSGRYDPRGDPAFYSFGPSVVDRQARELRSPKSFVKSWQVPAFGRRFRSGSV